MMDATCIYAYQDRCCHSAHVGTEHPCKNCDDRRTTPYVPLRREGNTIIVLPMGNEWERNLALER